MWLLLGCFNQSRKCMSLKFTGELCVMIFLCKIWRGINLSVQNWHEEIDKFWLEHSKNSTSCTLIGCFWQKYVFELNKLQRSYFWWHWRLTQNLKENWLVLSKITWRIWQIFVHSLKNRTQLNQNENLKQPDWLDAVWKLYFTFEINA